MISEPIPSIQRLRRQLHVMHSTSFRFRTVCFGLLLVFGAWNLTAQNATTEFKKRLEEVNSLGRQGKVSEAVSRGRALMHDALEARDSSAYTDAVNSTVGAYLFANRADSALAVYETAVEEISRIASGRDYHYLRLMTAMTKKNMGRYEEAFYAFPEILPALKPYPNLYSLALQDYGASWYFTMHNADSAMVYVDSALQVAGVTEDSVRLSSGLETRASILYHTGRFLESVESTLQALDYVSDKNALKKFQLLYNITEVFKEINQPQRAIEYGHKALDFADVMRFNRSKANAQNTLGELYFETGQYAKADSFYQRAEQYYRDFPSQRYYLLVKTNLAEARLRQGLPEAALAHLRDVEGYTDKGLQNYIVADFHLAYVRALQSLGQHAEARSHAYEALQIAQEIENPRKKLSALEAIKNVEEDLGNYGAALQAADAYLELYDSTFQLRQSQLLFESESRYQRAEQDKAIAELNAQSAIKDLHLKVRDAQVRYGLIIIGVFAILAGFIFYLYRQVRHTKNEVESKNKVISKALREKDFLLKEIHHRVKNNLQVVSSLLSLQSRYIEDAQALEAIREGRDRVKSMALIHQNLYQGEHLTGIEIRPYFEKVIRGLFNSYNISPERITMEIDVDDMLLDVDTIIPIGLIVNELVSNALKHAFPQNRTGVITVRLKRQHDTLLLEVSDNGVGMHGQWEDENVNSFGYRLIHAFREKLNADLTLQNSSGTRVEMIIRDFESVEESSYPKG